MTSLLPPTFQVNTAAGVPVNDLQLYLGEEMHVFAMRDDSLAWTHAHPEPPNYPLDGHGCRALRTEVAYPGPNVPILVSFPAPGMYKVHTSLRHKDRVPPRRSG